MNKNLGSFTVQWVNSAQETWEENNCAWVIFGVYDVPHSLPSGTFHYLILHFNPWLIMTHFQCLFLFLPSLTCHLLIFLELYMSSCNKSLRSCLTLIISCVFSIGHSVFSDSTSVLPYGLMCFLTLNCATFCNHGLFFSTCTFHCGLQYLLSAQPILSSAHLTPTLLMAIYMI